jgi:hypothetical protein
LEGEGGRERAARCPIQTEPPPPLTPWTWGLARMVPWTATFPQADSAGRPARCTLSTQSYAPAPVLCPSGANIQSPLPFPPPPYLRCMAATRPPHPTRTRSHAPNKMHSKMHKKYTKVHKNASNGCTAVPPGLRCWCTTAHPTRTRSTMHPISILPPTQADGPVGQRAARPPHGPAGQDRGRPGGV